MAHGRYETLEEIDAALERAIQRLRIGPEKSIVLKGMFLAGRMCGKLFLAEYKFRKWISKRKAKSSQQ